MPTPATKIDPSAEMVIKIDGKSILWCPAAEIEEADRVAAEARHAAANQPVAKAIRSQLVLAAINERQAAEARARGCEIVAARHARIAAECRTFANAAENGSFLLTAH